MTVTLTGLRRYPVKSCRGHDVDTAVVEPWGLAGDRRWMVVDHDGMKVTARELHPMLRIAPELVPGGILLTFPDREPLLVDEPAGNLGDVRIWDDTVQAAYAGPDADAWLSGALQRDVRLVFLDDPTRRAVDPETSQPGDVVTFADGYPMLLASTSSLERLNEWIQDGPNAGTEPLDMRRFRPNLVVSGAEPFAEDDWSRIRVGDATFRVAQGCSRCVLTTVHPDTIAKAHEPIATLARHRRWDGKVWFAVDLLPEEPGAVLRVGDEVEVLEGGRGR